VNGKIITSEKKLRLVEIVPGAGRNVTNLSRFSDWERWGYDWHLDVEPTLLAIAQRMAPASCRVR